MSFRVSQPGPHGTELYHFEVHAKEEFIRLVLTRREHATPGKIDHALCAVALGLAWDRALESTDPKWVVNCEDNMVPFLGRYIEGGLVFVRL